MDHTTVTDEASFSAASPTSYSLAEIWPFPTNGDCENGGSLGSLLFCGFEMTTANCDVSFEESTVTEQSAPSRGNVGADGIGARRGGGGGRKRKKENSEVESSKLVPTVTGNGLTNTHAKRMKVSRTSNGNDSSKPEEGISSGTRNKLVDKMCKLLEPPKDYIHVRARRGQATDSHSLAERARREKISERMKILQELVPGCHKVTGKTLVLDEIINYIQSLQCQVEYLSMKLEAINLRMNPVMEGFPSKDLGAPTYEAARMMFGLQASECIQRPLLEWCHMQVGSSSD